MRLIPLEKLKAENEAYTGLKGEIVSIPTFGAAIHDGVNPKGVLLTPAIEAAYAGRDNFVRNSDFSSIQNGTSFVGNSAAATYIMDGWFIMHNSGSTSNVAQLATYDAETNSTTQMRITTFTGGADASYSILAQTYHTPSRFAGKRMTLSYWIKPTVSTSITNEFLLTFADVGTANRGSLIGRQSLTANVWNRIESTFDVPIITSSDVISNLTDNGRLLFWLDAGDDWNTRTGGILPFSGTFDIANVKLEDADRATEYTSSDRVYEAAKVHEYYETSVRVTFMNTAATTAHTSVAVATLDFKDTKWTNLPTITFNTTFVSGVALQARDSGGFTVLGTSTSAGSAARVTDYIANAEITP